MNQLTISEDAIKKQYEELGISEKVYTFGHQIEASINRVLLLNIDNIFHSYPIKRKQLKSNCFRATIS